MKPISRITLASSIVLCALISACGKVENQLASLGAADNASELYKAENTSNQFLINSHYQRLSLVRQQNPSFDEALRVKIDFGTGCEWLEGDRSLVQRTDSTGKQICRPENIIQVPKLYPFKPN